MDRLYGPAGFTDCIIEALGEYVDYVMGDPPEPEWAAVDIASEEFVNELDQPGGIDMSHDFWATDKEDVYPVDPCDCGTEA